MPRYGQSFADSDPSAPIDFPYVRLGLPDRLRERLTGAGFCRIVGSGVGLYYICMPVPKGADNERKIDSVAMKNICAVTMVRNDDFFLRKWIAYYGAQLGEENLYVFLDGKDQPIPAWCGKANVVACERKAGNVARADRLRIDFLSTQAADLLGRYDMVIGTDVDEFLVVDPAMGKPLRAYLSEIRCAPCVSGLGLDIGQHLELEQPIDPSRPFLEQRRFAFLYSRYTKASVISRPVAWGSGFHRVRNHNYRIDPNLYLVHFGCVDYNRLKERSDDQGRLAEGWAKHFAKRARTITIVTEHKAHRWEKTVPWVRLMQRICRPIFALNKPTTFGIKWVVEIPERFRNLV